MGLPRIIPYFLPYSLVMVSLPIFHPIPSQPSPYLFQPPKPPLPLLPQLSRLPRICPHRHLQHLSKQLLSHRIDSARRYLVQITAADNRTRRTRPRTQKFVLIRRASWEERAVQGGVGVQVVYRTVTEISGVIINQAAADGTREKRVVCRDVAWVAGVVVAGGVGGAEHIGAALQTPGVLETGMGAGAARVSEDGWAIVRGFGGCGAWSWARHLEGREYVCLFVVG